MRIVEAKEQLYFEGRSVPQRGWLMWGALFPMGLAALWLLPEAQRFIGLAIWAAIWLALIALVPRVLGDTVRVTVDSAARRVVWARNGRPTRAVPFADIGRFDIAQLTTASRPYRTFQLFAALKDGARVTLAVDPNPRLIERALSLARRRLQP